MADDSAQMTDNGYQTADVRVQKKVVRVKGSEIRVGISGSKNSIKTKKPRSQIEKQGLPAIISPVE